MNDFSDAGNEVQGDAQAPGPNPAWNDVLSVLPDQFHQMVTPHFEKWDQAANSRVESVNSQLKQFEAYKPFAEHGISSDEIEQGLRLIYEVNNNPQNVYDALAKAYNFGQAAAAPNNTSESGEAETSQADPRYDQLQNGLQLVSQIVLADAQAKQAAQADWALDKELNELKEKHGEYDEKYVLAMMQNGMSGEEAVQAFNNLKTNFAQNRPFAPNILSTASGGAGVPSNAIDPTKLSSKDTKSLVAQMLEAAARQNN